MIQITVAGGIWTVLPGVLVGVGVVVRGGAAAGDPCPQVAHKMASNPTMPAATSARPSRMARGVHLIPEEAIWPQRIRMSKSACRCYRLWSPGLTSLFRQGRSVVGTVARVVLALEAHDVAEEVMHFLDRSGCARVVATAADDRQLTEAVRQLEPDAVIAQPSLVSSMSVRGPTLLALDTHESIASLRSAVSAGARGFFVWPADREQLASAAAACVSPPVPGVRRAAVFGIHGSRGGAGVTFVATHLGATLSRAGHDCILIDADPVFADVTAALGAPAEGVHTFGDLLPMAGELTAEHLGEALWTHQSGLRTLLAPVPQEAASVSAEDLRGVVQVAASGADVVVLHLPRALDQLARTGIEASDRILEVLSLDVMCLRAAKRVLESLGPFGAQQQLGFVVNRATRGEITTHDVERIFGARPLVVLPNEPAVARAQDHGALLPSRGRMARAFDRLAAEVMTQVEIKTRPV